MKIEDFKNEVRKLGIDVDNDILEKLEIYYEFLSEYNEHTNLTAITGKENIYLKHFYDSITIVKAVDLKKVDKIIDIGSGAGFPGIILKIFFSHLNLTLLDSNGKKTTFLKQLIEKLNLKGVVVVNERAEEYAKSHLNEFDLCVSRAVAFIDIISELSIPFIKPLGKVILMKGSFENEKGILTKHFEELNIKSYMIINFNLPICGDERNLVILEKNKQTINIKNYSQIIKRNKNWQK